MDSQLAYQQAFLQNAVAQNMQIQQQLMMQNQALNQMLAQTSNVTRVSGDKSMSPRPSDASPTRSQQRKPGLDPVYFGMTEAHRRASESQLTRHHDDHDQLFDPKLMSKTEPNTPRHSTTVPPQAPTLSALDAYGRAKTVRIGKWRWPPAKEDMDGATEGFFEFKMRKNMKAKDGGSEEARHQDQLHDSFDDPSDEIQGLDWGDQDNEEFNKGLKRSQSKDSFTIMEDSQDSGAAVRPRLESPVAAQSGNVGKLKISSEMKEKLEAAMGSRKSSVRDNSRERQGLEGINGEEGVKKLNENRKMILEQKLGGGKLKKWENIDQELHKSVDNETGSRKSSHNSQTGHIPVPPPPPIAPSFTRPLHVSTDINESTSLVSSYYSPGNTQHATVMLQSTKRGNKHNRPGAKTEI